MNMRLWLAFACLFSLTHQWFYLLPQASAAIRTTMLQNNPVYINPVPQDIRMNADKAGFEFLEVPLTNELPAEASMPLENKGATDGNLGTVKPALEGDVEGEAPKEVRLANNSNLILSEIRLDAEPKYHRDGFVNFQLHRLYKMQGKNIDVRAINNELRQINRTNKFALKGVLKELEGKPVLVLTLFEQQPAELNVTYDNQGRPRNGILRTGVEYKQDNIVGIGDQFKARTVQAKGTEFYELSYNAPINRWGGRIDGWGTYQQNYTRFDQNDPAFGPSPTNVDENTGWGVTIRQPIDKQGLFDVSAGYAKRHISESTFKNANTTTKTNKNDFNVVWGSVGFNKQYVNKEKNGYWGATHLSTTVFAEDLLAQDLELYRILVDGQQSFNLPHDQTIRLRSTVQQAPLAFFPLQMQPVTGALNVRGYNEGALLTDNLLFSSLEYYFPIPGLKHFNTGLHDKVRGVAFIDAAYANLDNERTLATKTAQRDTFLASAGVGLRIKFNQHVQGFVDAAWGLNEADNFIGISSMSPTIGPSSRVHFGVRTSVFDRGLKPTEQLNRDSWIHSARPKFQRDGIVPDSQYVFPGLFNPPIN
jgi:hemolysin activation/secretion protein